MNRRGARIAWISAVAFGALLATGPTWAAEAHGGGGGHAASGHAGFGHAGFGGGHSFGGARGFAAAPRSGGGSFHAPAYGRAYGGYAGGRVAGYAHVGTARAGFAARPGFGVGYGRGYAGAVWGHGWHPGYGWHWGGGYWSGRYWPPIFIGAGFAGYLAVVPAWAPVYWWGDVPYYYYNDVYYTWDGADNGYVASAPPPAVSPDAANANAPANAPIADGAPYDAASADAAAVDAAGADAPTGGAPPPSADGPSAPPPDSGTLYAYPKNGQSEQQQGQDQQACQRWAATHANGGATTGDSSIDYRRALAACLTGRGYSVD